MALISTDSAVLRSVHPLVVCIVVNYNGWADTVACLDSLRTQSYPELDILVVDNASTNESVARIHAACPWVEMLESATNAGFAAGCNLGIRLALARGAKFVWLLNNDTLAPRDTLDKLVAATGDPRTGLVGSVLRYMDHPAAIQAWGGGTILRSIGFSRHFYEPQAFGADSFLTFASVLIRTELFERVGLLDEGYFMYFEDADLCFRAREAGWQLAVAADTAILHKEGGSDTSPRNGRVDRIVTASGLRFLTRYGRPRGISLVLFVLSRLGKRLVRGDFAATKAVCRGVRDWHRNTPTAFREDSTPRAATASTPAETDR